MKKFEEFFDTPCTSVYFYLIRELGKILRSFSTYKFHGTNRLHCYSRGSDFSQSRELSIFQRNVWEAISVVDRFNRKMSSPRQLMRLVFSRFESTGPSKPSSTVWVSSNRLLRRGANEEQPVSRIKTRQRAHMWEYVKHELIFWSNFSKHYIFTIMY